ncbi:MAG: carboxylating nicotinate-nucleotide diphosphorylase [Anaerolineales bacterium]
MSPPNDDLYALLPEDLRHAAILRLIELGLAEDLSAEADPARFSADITSGDVTSTATIAAATRLNGQIKAKAEGVVAGLAVARVVFAFVSDSIEFYPAVHDGDRVAPGGLLVEVAGPGRALLTGERTALNFLGRMSGVASLTRRYAEAVAGTGATILDTRKTAPGSRRLDKYAVRVGGGSNHRMGLFDMALIKDNHIDGAGGLQNAVARVRAMHGDRLPVEVEVKSLDELETALRLPVDRIMLDNMDLDTMRRAVELVDGCIPLEASGNMTLARVRAVAETGVDFISVGALTHSAPVLDVSMRMAV